VSGEGRGGKARNHDGLIVEKNSKRPGNSSNRHIFVRRGGRGSPTKDPHAKRGRESRREVTIKTIRHGEGDKKTEIPAHLTLGSVGVKDLCVWHARPETLWAIKSLEGKAGR